MICLFGAIAFYLLYRWDLTAEPFPDIRCRSQWYDIRLIKTTGPGASRTTAISYLSQRDWVGKAFRYAGVVSNKKTQVGRSSGAKTAELKGVSEAQIRRACRWNSHYMLGCYLDCLPREFMRTMAGHPPSNGVCRIQHLHAPSCQTGFGLKAMQELRKGRHIFNIDTLECRARVR